MIVASAAITFVLTPPNSSAHGLAGSARRWHTPSDVLSNAGLGGGLAFVVEASLCARLLPRFRGEAFVDCHALDDAIQRALHSWSDNHPSVLTFRNITGSPDCTEPIVDLMDHTCAWEVRIGTDDGSTYPTLAAYVQNYGTRAVDGDGSSWWTERVRSPNGHEAILVDQIRRSVVSIQTHACFYLDARFCTGIASGAAAKLLVPLLCLSTFGASLIALLATALRLYCKVGRSSRRRVSSPSSRPSVTCTQTVTSSTVLDEISRTPPLCGMLIIYGLVFPLVFYIQIYLHCAECHPFEGVLAHEIGHVLGFSHPDDAPNANLAGCLAGTSTCIGNAPFECAVPASVDHLSVMLSQTHRAADTGCLASSDRDGLRMLYPTCDHRLDPPDVSCLKTRRLDGALRVAYTALWPLLLATALIILPLTWLKVRERRRVTELIAQLSAEEAHSDTALRDAQIQRLRYLFSRGRRVAPSAPAPAGNLPPATNAKTSTLIKPPNWAPADSEESPVTVKEAAAVESPAVESMAVEDMDFEEEEDEDSFEAFERLRTTRKAPR